MRTSLVRSLSNIVTRVRASMEFREKKFLGQGKAGKNDSPKEEVIAT